MSITIWILAAASFVYVVGLLWAWFIYGHFLCGIMWPIDALIELYAPDDEDVSEMESYDKNE